LNCSSLEEITLHEGIVEIGIEAFGGCESLSSLVLPSKLNTIETYAFKNCSALKEITIPEGVLEIRPYAFESCTSLETLTIRSKTAKLFSNILYGASLLTEIRFDGTCEEWYGLGKYADWLADGQRLTIICTDGEVEEFN
jgi:hypothetical protein